MCARLKTRRNPQPHSHQDLNCERDPAPIYAAYEQMRQAGETNIILVLVACQAIGEFREALGRLPIRKSAEWRSFDDGH